MTDSSTVFPDTGLFVLKLAICHFGHAFDKLEVGVYVWEGSRAASYRRVRSLMGNSVNLVIGLIVLITVI